MRKIIVTGIGTDVGKTVVSSIFVEALKADYWKPIQTGPTLDKEVVRNLVSFDATIFPEQYCLPDRLSPHHAARLQNISIQSFPVPSHQNSLIIESAGGLLVPINDTELFVDLASFWGCEWIIVSRNYLGSINHTLLTLEAIFRRNLPLLGIIFNGTPNPDSENAILTFARFPRFARLFPEKKLTPLIIRNYAESWKKIFF